MEWGDGEASDSIHHELELCLFVEGPNYISS
jgi:hypothetical protein